MIGGLDLNYFYKLDIFHKDLADKKQDVFSESLRSKIQKDIDSEQIDCEGSVMMETLNFVMDNEIIIRNIANLLTIEFTKSGFNDKFWKSVSKNYTVPTKSRFAFLVNSAKSVLNITKTDDSILTTTMFTDAILKSFFQNFLFVTPDNNFNKYMIETPGNRKIWQYNQNLVKIIQDVASKLKSDSIYQQTREKIKETRGNITNFYRSNEWKNQAFLTKSISNILNTNYKQSIIINLKDKVFNQFTKDDKLKSAVMENIFGYYNEVVKLIKSATLVPPQIQPIINKLDYNIFIKKASEVFTKREKLTQNIDKGVTIGINTAFCAAAGGAAGAICLFNQLVEIQNSQ